MTGTPDDKLTRREFFRTAGRAGSLGALALLAGRLLGRRSRRRTGETCINNGLCRKCRVFDDCRLPQALSAKKALGG